MILAISTMGAEWTAFFFVVAFVLLAVSAFVASFRGVALMPLGLAAFVFVYAWNALAST